MLDRALAPVGPASGPRCGENIPGIVWLRRHALAPVGPARAVAAGWWELALRPLCRAAPLASFGK